MPDTLGQTLQSAVWASVLLAAIYVAFVNLLRAVRSMAAREERPLEIAAEERDALAGSRFTIPVSLIVHVAEDSPGLAASVRSLLELQYPQLEAIVVTDARSGALDALKTAFELAPKEMFYRSTLPAAHVNGIYASARDSRLLVVDRASADDAAAWNCGVNLARYRYVAIVPAGRFCRADALLAAMAPANADPARVAAVVGDLGAQDRRSVDRDVTSDRRADASRGGAWIAGFEELEQLRAQAPRRLALADLGATLDSPEAFGVWRRDAVVEAGGFAAGSASAGLDLVMRLQQERAADAPAFRVLPMPSAGARRRGTVGELTRRHALRVQALLQAAWRMRHVSRSGQTQALARRLAGMLSGACEAWLLLALPLGVASRALAWQSALLCALIVAFTKGVATNAVLLRAASQSTPQSRRPLRTICLGALQFPLYRPVAAVAALTGLWQFVRRP